jgi:hypothetical protein
VAVALFASVALALGVILAGMLVDGLRRGEPRDGAWWLAGFPLLYAVGMAVGAARLRIPRRQVQTRRWVFGLLSVHALCGWVGTLAVTRMGVGQSSTTWLLAWVPEGAAVLLLVATVVAMLIAGVLALRIPDHVRRDGVLLLTALVGGLFALAHLGLLALGLLLLRSGPVPD